MGRLESLSMPCTSKGNSNSRGAIKQYQVVGRLLPTEKNPHPKVYRMKLFGENPTLAKSRFWFFMSRLRRCKKANGEVLAVNEITEQFRGDVKNFGFWLRYRSRTITCNMYKEYRAMEIGEAVKQLFDEMNSRHRVRRRDVEIIRAVIVPDERCRTTRVQMFQGDVKFPLPHRISRAPNKQFRSTFKAVRPSTFK